MELSASFLSIKENLIENIKKLNNTNIDYIHVDIMDGIFVTNRTWDSETIKPILDNITKPLDIHLMVSDVKEYIDSFRKYKPTYITFHVEAVNDVSGVSNYLQSNNIKAGISIKPYTPVSEIVEYLPFIDLVLVMSVEPGKGGQQFLQSSIDKIQQLDKIRKENNYQYKIEVDGGINSETIKMCKNADIVVSGSYITSENNYQNQIDNLKNNC